MTMPECGGELSLTQIDALPTVRDFMLQEVHGSAAGNRSID